MSVGAYGVRYKSPYTRGPFVIMNQMKAADPVLKVPLAVVLDKFNCTPQKRASISTHKSATAMEQVQCTTLQSTDLSTCMIRAIEGENRTWRQ